MNVGELLVIVTVLVLCGIGIAALALVLDVMFPRVIRRTRNTAERMPFRAAGIGFINLLFFSIISIALLSIAQEGASDEGFAGLLRLIAAIILLVLCAFIAFGIAAIARWVGERLSPNATTTRQIVNGIVALELASLAPFVGWVLVPLVTILVGYGAVIIALVWKRDA